MKPLIIALFSSWLLGVKAQVERPYATNLWLSAVVNKELGTAAQLSVDAGHRRCNDFVRASRQQLFRMVVLFRLGNGFSVGPGITWFGHTAESGVTDEIRPFVQVNYQHPFPKGQLQCRLRHEWRWVPEKTRLYERIRLQLQARKQLSNQWSAFISTEGFYTVATKPVLELRISTGISRKLGYGSMACFYTLQEQSTILYEQHIIGIQYSIDVP